MDNLFTNCWSKVGKLNFSQHSVEKDLSLYKATLSRIRRFQKSITTITVPFSTNLKAIFAFLLNRQSINSNGKGFCIFFRNVTGWPLPKVKWFMNGMEIRDGDLNLSVSLQEEKRAENINSSLHFSELDKLHAAYFTCEAKNKFFTRRRNINQYLSIYFFPSLLTSFTYLIDKWNNEWMINKFVYLVLMKLGKVTNNCACLVFNYEQCISSVLRVTLYDHALRQMLGSWNKAPKMKMFRI